MYKDKYVYAMIHPGVNCGYIDVYTADKKIKMSDLRKDYFQEIQTMSYTNTEYNVQGAGCAVGPKELGNGVYTLQFDFSDDVKDVVGEVSTADITKLNISNYIDVYIIFPDWETKRLELYRNRKLKAVFNGTEKSCSRYIHAFVYDVQSDKFYLDKLNKAELTTY